MYYILEQKKKSEANEQEGLVLENLRLDNRRLELEMQKIRTETQKLTEEIKYYQLKTLYIQAKLQGEFHMSLDLES